MAVLCRATVIDMARVSSLLRDGWAIALSYPLRRVIARAHAGDPRSDWSSPLSSLERS